ncbi:hypothetical protein [Aurantimonas coralicida]|uniref:hypothetical protein n=1 Tax=Aurantimonas coralicida TaxID=182270 RepID=UPI001E65A345|nr:hypothetical protein [Aurantimonas coralicida]MCD1644140.1 hypothetical protein [Aurantimonas coralicida]
MIELIVLACLATDPSQCRNERIGIQPGSTTKACEAASMMEAARWAGDHPKLVVRGITCRKAMDEA